jgi:hypothetical protein
LDNGLTSLLDTGAFIPVWTASEKLLTQRLNAQALNRKVPITGFGGVTYGNAYNVTLYIGALVFPNMPIVANSELNTPFPLILSATMFDGLIYEINTKTHRLNITVPNDESNIRNLKVEDAHGKLHIFCNSAPFPERD